MRLTLTLTCGPRPDLSDEALVAEVARLAKGEREATASLVAHLAELHARRLHERAGFSSLFTYCTEVLRLSEHEAYDRMKAAKVARRYPAVLALLASGRINLTTIRLVAPCLTRDNQTDLFTEAVGKSKRQVQEMLARRFPRPDVPASIRKLPYSHAAVTMSSAAVPMPLPLAGATGAEPEPTAVRGERGEAAGTLPVRSMLPAASTLSAPRILPAEAPPPGAPASVSCDSVGSPHAAGRAGPERPRPLVEPLASDRYLVRFTASGRLCDKLRYAQDLLRHAVPTGDPAEIVERAIDLLIEAAVKREYGATTRARCENGNAVPASTGERDSRHVPAEVRRVVFVRDAGRCRFVSPAGRRCDERALVELHHLVPYGVGGHATAHNIELRCRAHNGYEADVYFGPIRRDGGAAALREQPASTDVSAQTHFRSGTTGGNHTE